MSESNSSPIIYDESKPRAHYEAAAALKEKTFRVLNVGKVIPIFSFLVGLPCVAYNPFSMALFALFGLIFSILAVIGCQTRHSRLCLISIPLGFIAAMVLLTSGSDFSIVGAAVNIIAAAVQIRAIPALADFAMLKELPGFPFFDAGMENITFAALDRRDADEFIDESELYTESAERARYLPTEPPSEEMQEIFTDGVLGDDGKMPVLNAFERDTAEAVKDAPEEVRDEVILHLGHLAPNFADYEAEAAEEDGKPKSRYEQMINAQTNSQNELSDVELFG